MAAGIGHENIQAAELLGDGKGGSLHAGAVGCIGDNDRGSDLFGNGVKWVRTPPHERNVATLQPNPARNRRTDSRSPARNQGGLVLKAHDVSSHLEEYHGPKRRSRRVHFCSKF
jgi:hypothetical protein